MRETGLVRMGLCWLVLLALLSTSVVAQNMSTTVNPMPNPNPNPSPDPNPISPILDFINQFVNMLMKFINGIINPDDDPKTTMMPTTMMPTTMMPTTSSMVPTFMSTSSGSPSKKDKYGCSFGYQGKYCDQCGVQPIMPNLQIVGGIEAIPNSWPFQIFVVHSYAADYYLPKAGITYRYNNTEFICGGTLITRNKVLTAAHCFETGQATFNYQGTFYSFPITLNKFYPTLASRFSIYIGAHNRQDAMNLVPPAVRMQAIDVQMHENYDPTGKVWNDITIVTLEKEAQLNDKIQLACLPNPAIPVYPTTYNIPAYAMGWGDQQDGAGNQSNILLNVVLTLLDGSKLKLPNVQTDFNWNNQVCAGVLSGGKSTCQGDSGGPLYVKDMVNQTQKFIQVGVVSYGWRCAFPGEPVIFTRVSGYWDWIQKYI